MVLINKDAPKIADGLFWDWFMECKDFQINEYVQSKMIAGNITQAITILKSFKRDLEIAGKLGGEDD